MADALPQPGDCCKPCEEPSTVLVPGPQGIAGTNGTNGTNGENAYTQLTASFVMPAVSVDVTVAVTSSVWAAVGQDVFVQNARWMRVISKPTTTSLELRNLGYTGNAAHTTVIANGSRISPAGPKGLDGASATTTLNEISPTTTKGDLLVDAGGGAPANVTRIAVGTNGQLPAADSALGNGLGWKSLLPNTTDDNAIARYDGTTGKPVPIQNSKMLVDDNGNLQSTPSGGDARGSRATDLQTIRAAAAQVASGTGATIGGGQNNKANGIDATVGGGNTNIASGDEAVVHGGATGTASGGFSVVGGGSGNTASGLESSIGGGLNNAASATTAVVAGGDGNTASQVATTVSGGKTNVASGIYSTVPGGLQNTASGPYSIAHGRNALANKYGQESHAAGSFSQDGDAQAEKLVLRNTTTNATVTEIFLVGSSSRLVLKDSTTMAFRGLVVARRTDAADDAVYEFVGGIKRGVGAGTTAMLAAVTATAVVESDAAWDVAITADAVNGSLKIAVTGAAGKTVQWVCYLTGVVTLG